MSLDLSNLNANQLKAINWNEGPLLVLAGPGSGKTRVLTMRVARLILDSPAQRFRILGLTFTSKAAAEMRTRVDEIVRDGRERCLLTTFHSFSADMLRQHGSHINIRPDFVILNQDADREGVLADAINELRKQGADVDRGDVRLLPLIDRLLDNCVPESEISKYTRDEELAEKLSLLYPEYMRQLNKNNRLDFPSLLHCMIQLLKKTPAVAKQLRTIYTHVCVDEFQDTNLAQYRVLRAIVGDNPRNLFVVADDDQIIYQWNGASPERLKELRTDFSMAVLQLPANYRCPPAVIDIANRLISHNSDRSAGKEPLVAVKSTSGSAVRLNSFSTFTEEAAWVAADISRRSGAERHGIVILARTKKLLDVTARTLETAGVRASQAIRKNEFESVPIRWLHSMLRLANARGDREQLRRVCKSFYELEGINVEVQDIVARASASGGDLLRSWIEQVQERREVETDARSLLNVAREQLVNRLDFLSFISAVFKWLDMLESRIAGSPNNVLDDLVDEKEIWLDLQQQVVEKYGRDEVTLSILLQEFDLSPKAPPVPSDAVRCLTIHSSKGMEFEHVYLIGLVEDQLPSFASIKQGPDSREMQEERRNCFVAITRTQSSLTMTYAKEYFGWTKRPSRFLQEMGLIG